jgi:beta-glucosidase
MCQQASDGVSFPTSFLWGAATASYQIEGAATEDGRGRSIWDTFSHTPGRVHGGDTGDVAVDHYHRLEQDVALMVDLGIDAYRFSVAWPRIVPAGDGAVEPRGLAFYTRLVALLRAAGIEPVVTLYHWDLPQALQDRGGWANRATTGAFVRYAEVVHDTLGADVDTWMTINEPWCAAFLGYASGNHAPGLTDPRAALRAAHHLLLAHGDATAAMRRASGPAHRFGIVPNFYGIDAVGQQPEDLAAARAIDGLQNRLWLDTTLKGHYPDDVRAVFARFSADDAIEPGDEERIAQPLDLLGVNYYQQHHVRHGPGQELGSPFPGCETVEFLPSPPPHTGMGWGIEPDSLTAMLIRLDAEYDLPPIVICENGAAFDDVVDADGRVHDPDRRDFIAAHVAAVARAVAAGVDVRGYFVWSLLDNFEWAFGYDKRFGIVHVDHTSQQRTLKSSGAWYRDHIARQRRPTDSAPAGAGASGPGPEVTPTP